MTRATFGSNRPGSLTTASQQVSFTYGIADGRGGSDSALATVTVVETPTPLAPIAIDDLVGPVAVGGSATVDVLANDSDPDGRVAELTVVGTDLAFPIPPTGIVTLTDLQETTRLGYTITDPDGLTATGRVTVIVVDNVAPTTVPLAVETTSNTPIEIDITPQVADADGDLLYFTCCDSLRGGTTEIVDSTPGVLRVNFVPDTDVAGAGGFSYVVDDQNGHTVAGAVTVTVQPPANTPPTASELAVEAEAGIATPIALEAAVVDPDVTSGDVLSYAFSAAGAPVTLAGSTLEVSPPIDATGQTYTIDYTVTDSAGAAASAKVTVTVTEPKRPPPTAVPDVARTTQGEPIFVTVLANDVDPVGQGLTIIAANVTDGSGTASVSVDQVVYQPDPGYFGEATFTYTIEDARHTEAGRAVGTVSVTVIGRPGAPSTPQATADNATATVTWGLPPANGSPLTDVELQVNDALGTSVGVTSSRSLSGLVNGQPYIFRVRAANEAGWGEWSAFSAPVTPDTTPGRPSSPTVAFGDGQLALTWAAPANEGSAITGYEVEIGGGPSAVVQRGTATTYAWTGLQNGTNYQFRVTAINAAGRSDPSPWSDPEHPLREPGNPGTPAAAQRQSLHRPVVGAVQPERRSGHRVPGRDAVEPGRLGAGRHQRRRIGGRTSPMASPRNSAFGRATATPTGARSAAIRSRSVPCGAPTPAGRTHRPARRRRRPSSPTSIRATRAAGSRVCRSAPTEVPRRRPAGRRTRSPASPTAPATRSTCGLRTRSDGGRGVRCRTRWSRPDRRSVRGRSTPLRPAWAGSTSAGRPPTPTAARSRSTRSRSTVRSRASGWRRRCGGPASPTAPRTRSRSGPATTSAAAHGRPSRQATTNGPPNTAERTERRLRPRDHRSEASWGTPNGNGLGGRPASMPTSIRAARVGQRQQHDVERHANGTTYRVRVRACNAAGCARVERAWSQTARLRSPVDVTASYHGSASGPARLQHLALHVRAGRRHRVAAEHHYTVTCRWTGNPGRVQRIERVDPTPTARLVDDPACYYGYADDFWATVGSHESNTLHPPPP